MSGQFKDRLRELIESNGGLSIANLQKVAIEVREFKPDFSPQYLSRLLQGHPPNDNDRRAISRTLEPVSQRWLSEYWLLEDTVSRELALFAYPRLQSHVMTKEFVDYAKSSVRFRNRSMAPSETELGSVLEEYRSGRGSKRLHNDHNSSAEDEIDIFGLTL